MRVIPYILSLLSIGLIAFMIVADRKHQFFDLPEVKEKKIVLRVNTTEIASQDFEGCWLPISALTKDYFDNWTVYSVIRQADSSEKVVPHQVDVQRVEQDRAWVSAANGKNKKIMTDGLHLVVPGQMVRSFNRDNVDQ